MRGFQQSLMLPMTLQPSTALEPKGVVYTKRWVVDLLLDLAGYVPTNNLVDSVAIEPAAGDGAFLSLMIRRLFQCCQRLGRSISDCRNSLIAFELDEASAQGTIQLAVHTLIDLGVEPFDAGELANVWVRTGDYLFDSSAIEADFVIGNPPYVRLEEIPENTAHLYRAAYPIMCGRADLYIAFFEAALRQLRQNGTCAFICADRWMRNQYGAELRNFVTSCFAIDIVLEMHEADAFHNEVDAYPAITVIRRRKQGRVIVARADQHAEALPPGRLSSLLLSVDEHTKQVLPHGLHKTYIDTWFAGTEPWPCRSPEQLALLRRLEKDFLPLGSNAEIGIGVASGNDKVFITKNADLVEPSRLLKLAMAKDVRTGELQWSGHYLVDPWNAEGVVNLKNYPRLNRYFEQHGAALKKRHTAQRNVRDWYRTIDRVKHSLAGEPKLYIADIRSTLEPVLDSGQTYPHHNLYYIQSTEWDLEVLGGLLISFIGQFFIESYGIQMRGGYLRFQAQYLRRIRVPSPFDLTETQTVTLRQAFRDRDRQAATAAALEVYAIAADEMERALGH